MARNRSGATAPAVKGNIVVGTGTDTSAVLAVGANGTTLVADSAEATGLKWATASGSSGPAFRAYRTTSQQSLTKDAYTKVQFNAETFDTDSCYDPTTNYRFTPNKAGYYQFNAGLQLSLSGAGTYIALAIYKNGSVATKLAEIDSGSRHPFGADLIYANGTTDYFEIFCYLDAATTRNVINSESDSYFSGVWIRS